MFSAKIYNHIRVPIILSTIVALLFGFVCVGLLTKTMHMGMVDKGVMSMPSDQPCCNMSASHHFDTWKNIILVAPEKIRDALMLLAFALALGFVRFPFRYRPPDRQFLASRLYIRDNPDIPLFNHLKLAFARGILNPKVY